MSDRLSVQANGLLPAHRCRVCDKPCGRVPLTEREEVDHFGHVLIDSERGYCSMKCRNAAVSSTREGN